MTTNTDANDEENSDEEELTDEQRMWNILKDLSKNEVGRTVRIAQYSPVHKHRATDVIKSWDRQGLVVAMSNGARAVLTEKGAELDDIAELSK